MEERIPLHCKHCGKLTSECEEFKRIFDPKPAMNNLISIIEEAEKSFDEKFVAHITSSPGNIEHDRAVIFFEDQVKIKSHNRQTILKLVEGLEKWAESQKVIMFDGYMGDSISSRAQKEGYNEALDDLSSLLTDLKAKLK